MRNRSHVLFVGTFLSASSGTMGISEKIMAKLPDSVFILRASTFQNKVLRLIHIVWAVLFKSYDILHVDVFSGMAFRIAQIATVLGSLRDKKVILALRGGNLPFYISRYPRRMAGVLERADIIHTPSQMLRNLVEAKYGVDILYLPNFVDVTMFQYRRDYYKPFSLLWVRAFAEIYNPDHAIRILERVKATYPSSTLTMIGPDKGKLEATLELVKRLGLEEHVNVVGPVKNAELAAHYHGHEVFLNTTRYESFGVAVLEAACCGIPIVSYDVGEIPYLWKQEEEILVGSTGDYEKLAEHVKTLFANRDRATKQSQLARKKAEQYSWKMLGPEWIKILRS